MVGRSLQVALRELRAHLGQRGVMVARGGSALILGMSGPFHTLGRLVPLPRLAYCSAVVGRTHATGCLAVAMVEPRLRARPAAVRWAPWSPGAEP